MGLGDWLRRLRAGRGGDERADTVEDVRVMDEDAAGVDDLGGALATEEQRPGEPHRHLDGADEVLHVAR